LLKHWKSRLEGACYGTGFLRLGFEVIEDAPARERFQFGCFLESGLGQAVVSAWISRVAPSRFTMRLRL